MDTCRTVALPVALVLALELNVPAIAFDVEQAPARPPVVESWDSEETVWFVDWAAAKFSAAGLVLPPVTVEAHESEGPCRGHLGLTLNTPDSATLHLCTPGDGRGVIDRLTLIHELAHVWVAANVDAATREAFLEVHGLDTWWDAEEGWETQGVEWAAETVAWAVYDEGVRMIGEVDDDPGKVSRGYHVLTGRSAPATTVHDHSLAGRAQVLSAGAAPSVDLAALLNLDSLTLIQLREAWDSAAARRELPATLGDWTRDPAGSVVRTSITDAVELVVVAGDTEAVEALTLVGSNSGLCDAYDTLLAWTLLLEAIDPAGAKDLEPDLVGSALVERHRRLRGIIHFPATH